jgi:uncharacterized membrane protein YjjP (DUF1212 family)
MEGCCGQKNGEPLKRKLGECRTCMSLSFIGLFATIILFYIIAFTMSSPLFVTLFVGSLALSFIVLSFLHIIFYIRKRRTAVKGD